MGSLSGSKSLFGTPLKLGIKNLQKERQANRHSNDTVLLLLFPSIPCQRQQLYKFYNCIFQEMNWSSTAVSPFSFSSSAESQCHPSTPDLAPFPGNAGFFSLVWIPFQHSSSSVWARSPRPMADSSWLHLATDRIDIKFKVTINIWNTAKQSENDDEYSSFQHFTVRHWNQGIY